MASPLLDGHMEVMGRTQKMTDNSSMSMTRRAVMRAFAATAITAAPTFSQAAGFLRGAGDIRSVRMISPRTGEKLDTIYWIEGEYITDAVKEISLFMRDWRTDEVKAINPNTIDIMAASHNLLDATEPYLMLSGYRTAATNAMLRRRSRRVAKNSRHIKAQAADLRLSSRSVNQIFKAAMACGGGGVGKYTRSNFVHMDCGPVRNWGS